MGIFDFLKKIVKPTPQGVFLQRLLTGKATEAEAKAEAKKFATGLAITAPLIAVAAIPGAPVVVGRTILSAVKPVAAAVAKKPVIAIVGAGVIVSGAAPTIVKTLFKAGKVTGEVITGEKALTPETIAEVGKGVGAILGVAAVGTAAGLIGKKILEKKVSAVPEGVPVLTEKPMGIEGAAPITPMTAPITKEKKPYKRRRAKITPSVKQLVRINIINKPSLTGIRILNKRYLNQRILA